MKGDKLMVAREMGLASVGIYGAAFTIAGVMLTFMAALQNSVIPKIMLALKADREHPLRVALRYAFKFLAVCAAFALVFLLAYTFAAKYLLPARYSAAVSTVYVLVAMMLWRSFYLTIGTVTDYFGMTKEKLIGCVLGAVANLGVVALLIPSVGLLGAACGMGLGYGALGGWLPGSCLKRRDFGSRHEVKPR